MGPHTHSPARPADRPTDRPTRAPLNLTWQVPAEWTQSGPCTLPPAHTPLSLARPALRTDAAPFLRLLDFLCLMPVYGRLSASLLSRGRMMAARSLSLALWYKKRNERRSQSFTERHSAMTRSSARSFSLFLSHLLSSFPLLSLSFFLSLFRPTGDVRFCSIRRFRGIAYRHRRRARARYYLPS